MRITILKKSWSMQLLYLLLGLAFLVVLLTKSPVIGYDTDSYLNFYAERPPLYPIFLWLFKWCGQYQFIAVTWVKTILFGASLVYARTWLLKNLKIADFLIFIIFCVTAVTAYRLTLTSESLSFPFFIMAFLSAVDSMKTYQLKNIICLGAWVGLLILTRKQFYYFYLFFAWLIFWYWCNNTKRNKILISTSILMSTILITTSFDKVYHYFIPGPSDCYPSIGNQLIVQPLFLADANPADYFSNPAQKKYVSDVFKQMEVQKLTRNTIPLTPVFIEDLYAYYGFNFNSIQAITCANLQNMPVTEQNQFMIGVSKVLFMHDFKKNLSFFIYKYAAFAGNIPLFFVVLIIFYGAMYRLSQINKYLLSNEQIFVIVGLFLVLLNNALFTLIESYVARYFIYNYFIYYCLAALATDRLFIKNRVINHE